MKRREFLRFAAPASTLPFLVGGFSLRAYGRSPFLEALVATATETNRVLVLVQLNGGNDGLNTVIPLDQYSALSNARANILIDSAKVLKLSDITGLHPAMNGMQALYNDGKLVVLQGVSYPSPNFSHFRATDIWLTGADYNQTKASGWLGRYLDAEFPGFPTGYPSAAMPDPLAIQIGSVMSPGLQGSSVSMGMAIADPNASYILPGGSDTPPSTPAGHELTFVRQVAEQTQVYSGAVRAASAKVTNKSTLYPTAGQNSLADQLKIVARLVAGGLKTRVYVVNLGGFDTHSAQVDSAAHETGGHATLLGRVSAAIAAFQDDLAILGADDRVIGLTFSEFGRRIKSNASAGTDHGTSVPMFVFGKNVKGGIIGNNPVIPANATANDNLTMQFDFRQVYASIVRDWFGASQGELQSILATPMYNASQPTLGIIAPSAVSGVRSAANLPNEFALEQNYPNPFNPSTVIRYDLPRGARVSLEVFNAAGQRVGVLVDAEQSAGTHEVRLEGAALSSGAYFYRLQAGDFVQTRKAVLVR